MTFNPLAAGSIPARPTSKIKHFQSLPKKVVFHFSPNLAKLSGLCAQIAPKTFLALAMILCLASPVKADYKFAEKWSTQDTILQITVGIAFGIDYIQTMQRAVNHPDQWEETAPWLPKHPTNGQVTTVFVVGYGLHTLVSLALPPKYRPYWQGAFIVTETAFGLGFHF